jgi:hypothetical protein
MPAVDRGTVNQAQVKLSSSLTSARSLTMQHNRSFYSLFEPFHESDVLI